jgi:hypothetical protein
MTCPCGKHRLDRPKLEAVELDDKGKPRLAINDESLRRLEELVCSLSVSRESGARSFGLDYNGPDHNKAEELLAELDYFAIHEINEIREDSGGEKRAGVTKDWDDNERKGLVSDFVKALFTQTGGRAPSARTIERAMERVWPEGVKRVSRKRGAS